jgi:transcription elongation factor Elf1
VSIEPFEKSPLIYFLGFQTCPHCRETVFAAEGAAVTADSVRYVWTCDLCGRGFTTEVALEEMAA